MDLAVRGLSVLSRRFASTGGGNAAENFAVVRYFALNIIRSPRLAPETKAEPVIGSALRSFWTLRPP